MEAKIDLNPAARREKIAIAIGFGSLLWVGVLFIVMLVFILHLCAEFWIRKPFTLIPPRNLANLPIYVPFAVLMAPLLLCGFRSISASIVGFRQMFTNTDR